ncbi:MAG TPA: FHA domain-containing protein [Micropruina sp.]|nr:FHA domain-containing protein [Micropruina sp.]
MTTDFTAQRTLSRPAEPSSDVVGAGRRALLAMGVDTLAALLPLLVVPLLALTRLPIGWAWTIAVLAVLGIGWALVVDVIRTGQSPGRRLLAVRTVSTTAPMPPSPGELARRQVVHADLRAGRDPMRLLPRSAEPLLPATWEGWQHTAPAATGGWLLVLDNGQQISVGRPTLLGRNPTDEPGQSHAARVAIPDLTRSISRVHALVEPADDCLWLTDGGTTNGTRASTPSPSGGTVIERWLRPGERIAVRSGGLIHLGDRELRVTRSAQPGA